MGPHERLATPALLIALVGCGGEGGDSGGPALAAGGPAPEPADGPPLFVEVTAELGLPDTPARMPDGTFALPEIMGGGLALFDADGDGRLDLLEVRCPPPGPLDAPAPNRFWRQQGDGTFQDATRASGLGHPGYGQGACVGDADGDGDLDVLVLNYGPNAYFENRGDGTFVDATERAGFDTDAWTCSAAFVDYDRDGDLDVFCVNYVRYDPDVDCRTGTTEPEYCGPRAYDRWPDELWRNRGDGTFENVSAEAGIRTPGAGLGVLCADLSGDGLVDVYVANDGHENHMWVNRGDGTFRDESLQRGTGVNRYGKAEASMGLALGDSDGDGRLDLFMTHLRGENNTLYSAGEGAIYSDRSARSGLSRFDLEHTGFGCGFLDYDHDGDLDLAIVNGGVRRGEDLAPELGPFWSGYGEPNLLLENDGRGSFRDAGARAPDFARRAEVGRGLALGDLDGDGDVDLVATSLGGPIRVFRNDAARGAWLRVRAPIGTEVRVDAGGRARSAVVLAASSYASSSEPCAHFGLGEAEAYDAIEVLWPDGARERFPGGPARRTVVLRPGGGGSR